MNWSEYKKLITSLTEEEKNTIEQEAREITHKEDSEDKRGY